MRGTVICFVNMFCKNRITPACAGNRQFSGTVFRSVTDHPRVCGEQRTRLPAASREAGSPPRVRGTAAHRPLPQAQGGITPACAGNRHGFHPAQCTSWDHPRVCGEQVALHNHQVKLKGSPPRVRGTVLNGDGYATVKRITPACAGNSPRQLDIAGWRRDHPRVCGEQHPVSSRICTP